MSHAIAANPSHFEVAKEKWTGATEEMLDAAADHFARLARREGGGGSGGGEEDRGAGGRAGREQGQAAVAR